jgi:hypothetical protein
MQDQPQTMAAVSKCSRPAPIAVFAFRRLDLLKRTLGALEKCAGFADSPVVVFSDAARSGMPGEAQQVETLRQWLRPWCVRHGADLREAPANIGLRASITAGVSRVVEQHGRVIVLEDDILVSPGFLRFMNDALDAGEDRSAIYQVSGYFVPHQRSLPAVGLLRVPACWGWATWRRAWRSYSDDAAALLDKIRQADTHAFDINGSYGNLEALQRNVDGTLNTWFVRWYASVFLQHGLTIYPATSLTRNIGFGGGGTNCGSGAMDRTFLRQRIDPGPVRVDWAALETTETPEYVATLEQFYRWQNLQWAKPTWRERVRGKIRRLLTRS